MIELLSNIRPGSRIVVAGLVPAKGNADELIASAIRAAETRGIVVIDTLIQRRGISRSKKPGGAKRIRSAMNAATYIGTGKVKELAKLVSQTQAESVVFCNRLSQTQQRNVEEAVGVPVISIL
jgi:GTP-binding protein HflX